jgi:hypothetical protein
MEPGKTLTLKALKAIKGNKAFRKVRQWSGKGSA